MKHILLYEEWETVYPKPTDKNIPTKILVHDNQILYRGDSENIQKFEISKTLKQSVFGPCLYLSDDKSVAEFYASPHGHISIFEISKEVLSNCLNAEAWFNTDLRRNISDVFKDLKPLPKTQWALQSLKPQDDIYTRLSTIFNDYRNNSIVINDIKNRLIEMDYTGIRYPALLPDVESDGTCYALFNI